MRDKHLTVNGLAPWLDSLVAEITVDDRGECAVEHWEGLPCSVTAVAFMSAKCDPEPELCCSQVVAYVMAATAGHYACADCDRLCRDCWSVVVLP